jgi:hypothetical protein
MISQIIGLFSWDTLYSAGASGLLQRAPSVFILFLTRLYATGADVSVGIHGNVQTKEKEGKRMVLWQFACILYTFLVVWRPVDLARCQNSGSEPRNSIRWARVEFELSVERTRKGFYTEVGHVLPFVASVALWRAIFAFQDMFEGVLYALIHVSSQC